MAPDSARARAASSPSPHSSSPAARAIRLPHRFPLSTVEIYRGAMGLAETVSYQL